MVIEVATSEGDKVSPSETVNVRAIIEHSSPLSSVEWTTVKGYGYRTKDLSDLSNLWGPVQTASLGEGRTISQLFVRPGL